MNRTTLRRLAALAALAAPLAAAPASPAALPRDVQARIEAGRPARVARVERDLRARAAALGLGAADTLRTESSFTDEGGRTVIHLVHLHQGARVLGSQLVVHVEQDGALRTFGHALAAGIVLPGGPSITRDAAVAAAQVRLGARGPLAAEPAVERIVFPTRFSGARAFELASGRSSIHRGYAGPSAGLAPYVWAWRVHLQVHNALDGAADWSFVVHGDTGEILRADDLLRRATPAVGTGLGWHRGPVSLDMSQMNDGTYALLDTTRGTLPNPNLSYYADDGSGWTPTGMQVWWEEHDATGASTWNSFLFQGNASSAWGDGQPFTSFGAESGPNGQSAGVDAMVGLRTTWDFFGSVFGRNGLDGNGTTPYATALCTGMVPAGDSWWSVGAFGGYFGVGTWPLLADGVDAPTDLDMVAHEATHGVTSPSWDRYFVDSPGYEEAGLDEATSDFFSEMTEIWAARSGSDPANAIPATPGDGQIGRTFLRTGPLRWFDRPSRDGRSVDGWFDGVRYMDGHFSSGPLNRALHFLARGASATAGDDTHSIYLPAGMAGIGNDSAARIWYRAVTEYLVPDLTGGLTYDDAREAALSAAADLFGAGSAEAAAVEDAFAAVNVGQDHAGTVHAKVWFKPWRNGDYIEIDHIYSDDAGKRQYFPRGENVRPRITVENAADTSVTWSVGGPSMWNGADYYTMAGGRIEADGSWTTPFQMGWHAITATSVADPTQFAEGRAFLVNLDMDSDLEQDATDMAELSYSWYLSNGLNPSHSVFIAPWVDDQDVSTFVDAMKAAWPVP